ncbi:MAG: hypothetical protein ACM3KE_17030 [Hyphomicrobiales bacterium]
MRYIDQVEEIQVLLQDADYAGVKAVESDITLREFYASMFAYSACWEAAHFEEKTRTC